MFPQEHSLIGSSLEQMLQQFPYAPMPIPSPIMDRSITSSTRWKPNIEVAPNCPRCASTNTKFCYYNNYSLSQPRYFCKGCRRYWTKGGSLRNVPVGGGCRKKRRGKAARHSQSESPSTMNNNTDGNSDYRESSASDRVSETNGSRDIDMALVFAKFLNQKPCSDHEELFERAGCNNNNNDDGPSCSNNMSTSLTTPESVEMENDAVVQPLQKGREIDAVIADSNADDILPLGLLGGVPVEGTMENFGGESDHQLSLSGIDELEGFDVVQDVVWCDNDDAITCCWQPPLPSPPLPMMQMQMQLQELEYSMSPLLNAEDDHQELLPICTSSNSMNLISEGWSTNWSPFDLSTMEVFSSRP